MKKIFFAAAILATVSFTACQSDEDLKNDKMQDEIEMQDKRDEALEGAEDFLNDTTTVDSLDVKDTLKTP